MPLQVSQVKILSPESSLCAKIETLLSATLFKIFEFREKFACFPILFVDCVHIKIHRKRSVDTEAFYVMLAVKEDKTREVIGI
ncbi:MAG: transposase, partial [Bacteroidales bacterium]